MTSIDAGSRISLRFTMALVGLLASGCAVVAWGQANYPNRPIRMVVPFAPGGASDFAGRIIQPRLTRELGQQIVIDNRAGADGNIGVEVAARANPDGHTLLFGNIGTMAINPSIYPGFQIKPTRDLSAVTQVMDVPGAMAMHPSIPVATIKEFIEYAKARPGQLNYGSAALGSAQRLAFEFFKSKAGIKLLHISYYKAAGGVTIALLGGEIQVAIVTITPFIPLLKSGKVKVLAVIAPKRMSQLPDIPTMAESGFPELTLGSWVGVYAPAGTPRPIINRLHSAVIRTMDDPEVVKRLGAGGVQVVTSKSPEDFASFTKTQTEFWARIVKQTGAAAE